jgi:hypothetical protein
VSRDFFENLYHPRRTAAVKTTATTAYIHMDFATTRPVPLSLKLKKLVLKWVCKR